MERVRSIPQPRENQATIFHQNVARAAAVIGIVALLDIARDEYQIRSDVDRAFPNPASAADLANASQRVESYNNLIIGIDRVMNPADFDFEQRTVFAGIARKLRDDVNPSAQMLTREGDRQRFASKLHDENNPKRLAELSIAAAGTILLATSLLRKPERGKQKLLTPLTYEDLRLLHGTIQSLHSQHPEDYDHSHRSWKRKIKEVFDVQFKLAQEMQLTDLELPIFISSFSARLGRRLIEQAGQQFTEAVKRDPHAVSDTTVREGSESLLTAGGELKWAEERVGSLIDKNIQEFALMVQRLTAENPSIPIENQIGEQEIRHWLQVTAHAGRSLADALWQQPTLSINHVRNLLEMHAGEIQRESIEIALVDLPA